MISAPRTKPQRGVANDSKGAANGNPRIDPQRRFECIQRFARSHERLSHSRRGHGSACTRRVPARPMAPLAEETSRPTRSAITGRGLADPVRNCACRRQGLLSSHRHAPWGVPLLVYAAFGRTLNGLVHNAIKLRESIKRLRREEGCSVLRLSKATDAYSKRTLSTIKSREN